MTTSIPDWLATLLRDHRNRWSPRYGGGLADHLPMAALAQHGLGASRVAIERYAKGYSERLDQPLPNSRAPLHRPSDHFGDASAYGALLDYFDERIAADGIAAVVAEALPPLLSGWVQDAYHPLIRLGYGIRFDCPTEVAAGLAYATCVGPDAKLEAIADTAVAVPAPLAAPPAAAVTGRTFNARYASIRNSRELARAAVTYPDNNRIIAEWTIGLFNATHDFFALHLVTGTHAFRICTALLGAANPAGRHASGHTSDQASDRTSDRTSRQASADALLNLGVFAGYLAVGAPDFDAVRPSPRHVDDEHDAKLAFTCIDLATELASAPLRDAADVYRFDP